MYPESSRIEKNKNRTKICGKNPITAKIPPNTPSTNKPLTHSGAELKALFANVERMFVNPFTKFERITPGELMPASV